MTQDEAAARQEYYREWRRIWAQAIGNPYLEDGGTRGGRSGDAAPREAATEGGSNF